MSRDRASGSGSGNTATVSSGDSITNFDGWEVTIRPTQFSRQLQTSDDVPMTLIIMPPKNIDILEQRLGKTGIRLRFRMSRTDVKIFVHSTGTARQKVGELLSEQKGILQSAFTRAVNRNELITYAIDHAVPAETRNRL